LETPYLQIESTGAVVWLCPEVTTVGRGQCVDICLDDPSVSKLHAEIVRRGAYAYVSDLGLSRHGTRVNGKVVAQRLLESGDVISFGMQRCRVGGLPTEDTMPESDPRRSAIPELTRRELDVVAALCKPALSEEAVKQHLLRLYQKLQIAEGPNRRVRLANEVVARGLVRPLPVAIRGGRRLGSPAAVARDAAAGGVSLAG